MPIPTAPTLLLAVGAGLLILGRWVQSSRGYEVTWLLTMLSAGGWLVLAEAPQAASHVAWANDPLTTAGQGLALAIGTLFGIGSFGFRSPNDRTAQRLGFLSFQIAGVMLIGGANDLITMALSAELVQFANWALRKTDGQEQVHDPHESDDNAYRWLGIAASGCLWLGMALLTNLTASTQYDQIRQMLTDAYVPGTGRAFIGGGSRLGLLGLGLIVASLGSRMGLVPWQIGLLESCRNVNYWTAGCVVAGSQLAGVVAMARLLGTVWMGYRDEVLVLLLVLALLTFSVAAGLAGLGLMPGEGRLRRWAGSIPMLHGAWLTIGLMACVSDLATPQHSLAATAGQPGGLAVLLFAAAASQVGLAGMFLVLASLSRTDRDVEFIDELLGLRRLQPVAASALVVVLASLIGHPPLWGFWSNWLLMISGLNVRAGRARESFIPHAGLILVVIVAAIATLMTAGVVIRCARIVLLEQPISRVMPQGRRSALVMACACAVALVGVGLSPGRLLTVLSNVRAPAIESSPNDPTGSNQGTSTASNSRQATMPYRGDSGLASSSTYISLNQAGPPSTASRNSGRSSL